jgi:hypothetical protein
MKQQSTEATVRSQRTTSLIAPPDAGYPSRL